MPAGPPPPPPIDLSRPAPSAPAWEHALWAQIEAGRPEWYPLVVQRHPDGPNFRVLCATLEGLAHFVGIGSGTGDVTRARQLLGWAAANGSGNLGTHGFVVRYLADRTWPVEIADGVTCNLTLAQDVALLAAAELHQAAGDIDAAIWVVEQADPTSTAGLSLAELYSLAGRDQDVVDLTNGLDNADDATAFLLVLRGRALSQLGYPNAAREALKQAMRSRSRAPEIRRRALLERAQINLAQNRRAAARKDLEAILAEDATYPGLAEALANMGGDGNLASTAK